MKNSRFKSLFTVMIMFLGFIAVSQINGEHYVYDRDTLIYTEDNNIFQVENLGATINSSHVESGPRITPDGKTLYFFRVNHPENIANTQDIWTSNYVDADSSWTQAIHVDEPLNCHGQNAVHWISRDGNTMLLHNKYYKNGTVGNGVSITYKKDGVWTFPKALKIKGYKNHEVCSFFMNDGMNTLLMCVQQKKTYGHQDIYVSFSKGKSGHKWSKPLNMGNVLNSSETEATVWLNHSSDTIYFSSNGQANTLGGMDVYRAIRTDTSNWTSWTRPVNLGSPYNTPDDEYYFSIPDEGDYIYMAHHFEHLASDSLPHSDLVRIRLKELFVEPYLIVTGRLFDDWSKDTIPGIVTFKIFQSGKVVATDTTRDKEDEYYAKLPGQDKYSYYAKSTLEGYFPEEGILDITSLVKGIEEKKLDIYLKRKPGYRLSGLLFDDETKGQIPGELIITLDGSDEVYKTVTVDSLLGYDVLLEPGKKYNLKYKSDGYFNKRESIDLRNLTTYKEEKKDVYLTPFKEGQGFVIKNIFFELDKAKLKPESFIELDNLVEVLGEYPYIVVEIQGHTDDQGSDSYNEGLSQRRAQAVVDYIVSKGIPKHQFVAKGYGEKAPRATNDTEEGRQINRRVEFKILKINKK